MRALLVAVVALAGAGLGVAAAVRSPSATAPASSTVAAPAARSGPPPRLLLVTWDTTRADHLGSYGWKSARTPCFDRLAANGVLYEHAWAAAPITLPSHTTILTGVYPCAHGVRDNGLFAVAADATLLPEVLKKAGWRTAAFVGSFILDKKFGLDQGFDYYDGPDVSAVGLGWSVIDRPAPQVTEPALAFLDTIKPNESFFLWVHYYDPHWPHETPPQLAAPKPGADGEEAKTLEPYDAEIALCDQELQRLLDGIRARGLDAGLVTAVTADHGESLGEHREVSHCFFVYDATMHVPLVIAPPPPSIAPGTRIRAPVSTTDLAASLLERVGLSRSLLPDAKSPALPARDESADEERALLLETYATFHIHCWSPLRALVWKDFKYVAAPRPELYQLSTDPHELEDLHATRADVAARMSARLTALIDENPPLGWEAKGQLTADDQEKLNRLGYLAANVLGDPLDPTLPDPKDRIGDLATYEEIEALLHAAHELLGKDVGLRTGRRPDLPPETMERARGFLTQAKERNEGIRATNPRDPFLDQIASTIELDLGDYAAAIGPLERAVVSQPRNMPVRYNLAVAYAMTEKTDWARREMEKAIFVEPRSLAAHRWILQFTVRQHDWPAAAWWAAELAKCPGQTDADLEQGARDRARIVAELAKLGKTPRPPAGLTEKELTPEGLK